MKSALMRPPRSENSTRARRVKPRLPPSPTTRARSSRASTRIASEERSCASASVSEEALTTVPMPPFHSRSTGARRIARMTSVGAGRSSSVPKRRARLRRQRDRLRRARPHPAALGDQRPVVVVPRGARQLEQPLALGERGRRVGRGVDEDVPVVVGGDEPELVAEQHPVAEHVARHVADPDDGELVHRRVHVHLVEVALDRLPRAARGDAELLVVVAGRAAGGERVVEPEAVLARDAVGDVADSVAVPLSAATTR